MAFVASHRISLLARFLVLNQLKLRALDLEAESKELLYSQLYEYYSVLSFLKSYVYEFILRLISFGSN